MKLGERIAEVNGYKLKENWYESFSIADEEQAREYLHKSWGSSDRHRGSECHRCRGRGYTKSDANAGCINCCGTGVIDE